jgi:predicted PurR-regulated permease PerM
MANHTRIKVDIETRTFVRLIAVLAGFVLVGLAIWQLKTPLTILIVSAFLALALNPPVTKLASYLPRGGRVGATAISYLVVVTVLGGLLILAVPPAVEQSANFAKQIPGYIENLEDRDGAVRNFLRQYDLEPQLDAALDDAKSQANALAAQIGKTFVSGVGALINGVVSVIIVLVTTFFMLIEGPRTLRRMWALYSDKQQRDHHKELLTKMYRVVTGYVNGQVLVASIGAATSLVVLTILAALFDSVPYGVAFPLAGIVFLGAMVPVIGTVISTIFVTVILLLNNVSAALIFLVFFVVYQQIENNVIHPIIQTRTVELTMLTVAVAILIGVSLFGILGALIAIPVAGSIRVLLSDYIEHRDNNFDRVELLADKTKKA